MSTPATLNGQELELFRVGDYGKKGKYTAADLQDLASRYASSDQAAITLGHPESDSEPAWGWIKSLRFADGKLLGTPGEVQPHFDSLVQAGSYKHRSIGIQRGQDGKLRLRHVAFLGAVPPAIQGLQPAKFSSDPFETFALGEGDTMADEQQLNQKISDGITSFFSNLFRKSDAGDPVPASIEALRAEFSAKLAAERQAREAAEAKFSEHQKSAASTAAQTRADKAVAELKAAGTYVPAFDAIGVPAIFSALASAPQTIKFSDASGQQVDTDLLQAFSSVLAKVGKIVPAGTLASGAQGATSTPATEVNGIEIDPTSATFSDMVNARAAEQKIPYTEAYKQLVREGKKPAPGAAAAGAV